QADDAQHLAAQLAALQRLLFPLAGMHGRVSPSELTSQGKHESEGVFGNRYGIAARRVHHHDAALGGGIEIDIVDAHPGASYDAQLGRLVHHGGVNESGGAHQNGVGIGQFPDECLFVGGNHRPVTLLSKDLERCGRAFISNYDFHNFTASANCSAKVSCTARTPVPSSKLCDGATFSSTCSSAPITPMASR